MNTRIKLINYLGLLTFFIVMPITACSSSFSFSKKVNYDFGIAIPPINNLNYVKYNSLDKLLPTLIQGIGQKIEGDSLVNRFELPDFELASIKFKRNTEKGGLLALGELGPRKIALRKYKYFSGFLKSGADGAFFDWDTDDPLKFMAFSLSGLERWKGSTNPKFNRKVKAQDFIDYIKYVGDINVGSSKQITIREMKIKGFRNFIQAQKNYFYKFGTAYKKPWGHNLKIRKESNFETFRDNWESHWSQQEPNDKFYREQIKNAALEFLLLGMRLYPPGIKENSSSKDFSNTDFTIQFDSDQGRSDFSIFVNQIHRYILPINKEFVESVGGIEWFGSTFDKWLYTSAFNISSISLGQGGYIDLEKDFQWPSSSYTIPSKIKIYFKQEPSVVSSMFEDKYISATDIPAIFVDKLWANKNMRQFMQKRNGYGTMSLQMNLDKNTNKNSPLQNLNFRKAIAHSIDRAKLIKLLNWEFSFPVTTWTLLSKVYSNDYRSFDDFLANEYFREPFSQDRIRLTSSSVLEKDATKFKFESSDKKDNRFSPEKAWKYYELFMQDTGNTQTNKLIFLSSNPSQADAASGLQTMLSAALNNKVKIEVKSVPQNAFEILRQSGQFDLTTYNFDNYGSDIESYMKRLFFPDEINLKVNKKRGFIDNPTGSWTFYEWYLKHKNNLDAYEKYLEIPQNSNSWRNEVWKKLIKMVSINPKESSSKDIFTLNKKLYNALTKIWSLKDDLINTVEKQYYFVILLEKIIALTSPIIPLMDVDNAWYASRLYGLTGTFSYSLQSVYDVLNKPLPWLPGKSIWLSER